MTRYDATPPHSDPRHGFAQVSGIADLVDGIRYVRREPHVAALLLRTVAGEALLGEAYSHKFSKITTFNQSLQFFPNLTDTGEFRSVFNLGIVTQLTKVLSWQVSFANLYLSNPPVGVKTTDGRSVKSCNVLAVQADGHEVTTVEGLAHDGELHPVQKAFHECHALQCGFCTPGMIMNAYGLLLQNPRLTRDQIVEGMNRNLCRCAAHKRILQAVEEVAGKV